MAKRAVKAKDEGGMLERAAPAAPVIVSLDGVIGQEGAKRTLRAAMASGRVHHAWIFHGPAGVGKLTTARAFAAALLDEGGGKDPASPVLNMVRAGTHPDLHIITKEMAALSRVKTVRDSKQSSIARDVIEEFLLEPASRTRVLQGGSAIGKVFIIDEAELVTPAVQNVLLKTLEEPPMGTAIILVTSNEDRLLPTIRSRCQRVAFGPLDDAEMDGWFAERGVEREAKRRSWMRSFAAGSPGLALLAAENDLFRWHETVSPLLAITDRGGFPGELGTTLAKLIAERAEADVKANPDASKDGANKVWARRMLAFLSEHYRGVLRAGGGGENERAARALAGIEAVQAAEGHLAMNVNLTMLLENLAAQLAAEPVGV